MTKIQPRTFFQKCVQWSWLCLWAMSGVLPSAWADGKGGIFDVRDFGAKGDGRTIDTAAIQHAVEACAAVGGGRVLVPPGRYLSGTIQLKSHIALQLEAGSALVGVTNLEMYSGFAETPAKSTPHLNTAKWYRGLLVAQDAEDIVISGPGTIDGNRVFDPNGEEKMRGPHAVLLGRCKGCTLRELNIRDAGNYAVLIIFSDQVDVRQVKITGGWDGVHIKGTPEGWNHDVNIVGCQFYTGDDCIAGDYWERTVISDCILNTACNGIRLIGPAVHLMVHGCLFYGPGLNPHRTSGRYVTEAGICLQPSGWSPMPGLLDDILLADLTMHNVQTAFHIVIKPGNTAGNIHVERVSASGLYGMASSVESWADTPMTNVVFRDVTIEYRGGGQPAAKLKPVRAPGRGARALPVWGFYAHQVAHLELDHVRLRCTQDDTRPVLQCEQVGQLDLDGFGFRHVEGAAQAAVLTDVGQVRLRQSDFVADEIKDVKLQIWK